MGRRKKHKKIPKDVIAMKYDTNTIIDKQHLSSLCADSTIEEEQQLSSIHSSWLPFKWVSRYDDNDKIISKDSNTNTSSTNQPSHNSLLSELNDIKQQLMPAAKSCADAINNIHNNSSTTANATNIKAENRKSSRGRATRAE